MAVGEDRKIIIRSVTRRATETVLLVLGLSLGIGASAAGIAIVSRTIRASEELLASPKYREIIVSSRSEAAEMATPLVATDGEGDVVLTSLDLRVAKESPDVAHAYIKQPRVFRNAVPLLARLQQEPGAAQARQPDGPAAEPGSARGRSVAPGQLGDEPVLDEWYGYAVSPSFFDAWGLSAAAGDLFGEDDIASGFDTAMVLGSELAATLFEDGEALGRKLIDIRRLVTITGVLEQTGTESDRLAFVPAFMPDVAGNIQSNDVARLRGFWSSDLSFMVPDSSRLDEAAAQIRQYFEREYGADAVAISVPRDEAEATRDRNTRLTTLILFLGVSGLLIAGVNVSNILLSRAMRRQRTIGILKALGATRNGIFRLFFAEALAVGAGGTVVGVAVAVVLARLMQSTLDIGGIDPAMLAVGLGASWVITTGLTVFPAMQASRIPAAEAMRAE